MKSAMISLQTKTLRNACGLKATILSENVSHFISLQAIKLKLK